MFDNRYSEYDTNGLLAANYLPLGWDNTFAGYKCDKLPCLQNLFDDPDYPGTGRGPTEDFADMFLNWVLDENPDFPDNGFTVDETYDRSGWMNGSTMYQPAMKFFLSEMGLVK